MSTHEEMIAHERTISEITAELGCDSLHYLSMAGVYEAVGATRANHCDACFTGEYPLDGTGEANGKYALEGDSVPLARV
jgi:amidophosphoribosyltransferase